jgi:hypothetical protein
MRLTAIAGKEDGHVYYATGSIDHLRPVSKLLIQTTWWNMLNLSLTNLESVL